MSALGTRTCPGLCDLCLRVNGEHVECARPAGHDGYCACAPTPDDQR